MHRWIIIVCFCSASLLNAVELFDRSDSHSSALKVSGELLLLSQNVGLFPKKGPYATGYRINIERAGFVQALDFDMSYTFWDDENEKHFIVPIWDTPRTIQNSFTFQNVDVAIGFPLRIDERLNGKLYAGIEWMWRENKTVLNRRREISNLYDCYGPLLGLLLEGQIWRYLCLRFDFSCASLYGNYQRTIDQIVCFKKSFDPFRGRVALSLQSQIFFGDKRKALRICGGLESMHFWGAGNDQKIHWKSPLSLQGFFMQLSLEF